MADASFAALATQAASTKRNPAAVAGKVGPPVANLTSMHILPLMPVSSEISEFYQLRSPRESKVTYVEGTADIAEGDRLVVGSTEYVVRAVGEWDGADADFREVIVEELKA